MNVSIQFCDNLVRIGRKEVSSVKQRQSVPGSWDTLWRAAAFSFICIFFFSLLVGVFIYIIGCYYLEITPFIFWTNMEETQRTIIVLIFSGIFIFSLLLTVMLAYLYDKLIYSPMKELLRGVEKSSGYEGLADNAVLYLQGVGNKVSDLYKPQEFWADRIHDYIENATQERYFDETTGCFNRKYFSQALSQILNTQLMCSLGEMKKPLTTSSYSYALYLVDIDHFKMINDEFGHNYGDQVLGQVGQTLRNAIHSNGIVIRNGGEEFLIVVCLGYPLDYSGLAEKIRCDFNETVYVTSLLTHEIRPVTCSIGFVPFPVFTDNRTAFSVAQYVNLADQAMYMAKTEGRNTWRGVLPRSIPPTAEEFERAALSVDYGAKAGYFQIERPPDNM